MIREVNDKHTEVFSTLTMRPGSQTVEFTLETASDFYVEYVYIVA